MSARLEHVYHALPVPLQNLVLSAYGWKLRRERFHAGYDRWMSFLDTSESWSREELAAWQDEKLAGLIRHAFEKVPYYREIMHQRGLTPDDIRTQADLVKLPVLTKEILRRRSRELVAEGIDPASLKASPTSGTTGSPLTVLWDRETDLLWNVAIWRHRNWAGIRFGDSYATVMGRLVVPPSAKRPPFWRHNRPWNQTLFSSFHMAPENIPHYVRALRACDLKAMEAYPSTGYILALGLQQAGAKLALKAVFTSSEPLLDLQRELIEDRFGCRIFDYYGMSEAIMFAGECAKHEGLHHHAEMTVVEVLGPEGTPVADGQVGRLVGTTLHNRAMPLIRYEVGDLTSRRPGECGCGRAHPLFSPVTTKAEDILVTPDGRLISPSLITHPLKPLKGLARSQFIQEDLRHITVKLVLEDRPQEEMIDSLVRGLKDRLGEEMQFDIKVVDDIPVGPTGKFRWIVSRVPIEHKVLQGGNLYTRTADEFDEASRT